MGKLITLVLLALSLGMTARAQLIVGGGGPCVLAGSQTSGYVLTATDGAQGCSWQTAGGASVDANTIKNAVYCPDTSGSANTITCAPTTTFPSSYAAGQAVWVLVANSNSGAATINVKSLGAKAVTKNGATALASGNLIANHAYLMMYDGTQFQVLTYTPLATDIPTLAPLASPTFTGTVSGITATMVGLGSVTNNAQTQSAIVPNTAPSAGQMLVGNAGGTAYAPVAISGSCTMASTGAISCSGSGASTTLNNLGTTSINAPLLFQTGLSLGSASAPPRNLFFYGSGTYASGSMKIDAATGTTAYTAIVPTTNASDTFAMLGAGNAFTAANTITKTALNQTSTDGLILNNTTAATSGNAQWSPRTRWSSFLWNGASQEADFIAEIQPRNTSGQNFGLVFSSQVNGGGYTGVLCLYSGINTNACGGNPPNVAISSDGLIVAGTNGISALVIQNLLNTYSNYIGKDASPTFSYTINRDTNVGFALLAHSASASADLQQWVSAGSVTSRVTAAGNFQVGVGENYQCTHGSNSTCGVSTLSGGTVTVSTTAIGALAAAGAAGYVVSLTELNCSGTCAGVWVGTVTAATSFVINGATTDNSNVYWEIKYVN